MSMLLESMVRSSVTNPLVGAKRQLRYAADFLGHDDGMCQILSRPRREVAVSIPLRRENGDIKVAGTVPGCVLALVV